MAQAGGLPDRAATLADQLLDEVLPEELDWRRLVRRYPRAALTAAAGLGFLFGYRQGSAMLAALGAFAASQAAEAMGSLRGA